MTSIDLGGGGGGGGGGAIEADPPPPQPNNGAPSPTPRANSSSRRLAQYSDASPSVSVGCAIFRFIPFNLFPRKSVSALQHTRHSRRYFRYFADRGADRVNIHTAIENGMSPRQVPAMVDANTAPAGPRSRTRKYLNGMAIHAIEMDAITW